MLPFVVKKVIFLVENGFIYGWLFFWSVIILSVIFLVAIFYVVILLALYFPRPSS